MNHLPPFTIFITVFFFLGVFLGYDYFLNPPGRKIVFKSLNPPVKPKSTVKAQAVETPPDVTIGLEFITKKWPQLTQYIPQSAVPFRLDKILDGNRIEGFSNNLAIRPDCWLGRMVGSKRHPQFPPFITDPQVPAGYFACGIHFRHNFSEYLFAMWERGGRRFWFCNRFFSAGNPEGHSASETAEALKTALRQWEGGANGVMYFGDAGWFISETNEWRWNP